MSFELSTECANGCIVITVNETKLNYTNSESFLSEALKITKDFNGDVVLNLESLKAIDSSGITKLLRLKTCLGIYGQKMSIYNANNHIMKTHEITWLYNDVFDIYEDLDSALKA